MGSIGLDLAYAVRRLWDRPAFTIGATILLAFGLGLNAILFSILDGLALRPFPVTHPERFIQVQSGTRQRFSDKVSYPEYRIIREELTAADAVTSYQTRGGILKLSAVSEAIPVGVVSAGHFRLLGIRATAGGFEDFERSSRAEPAAVISHSLWKRRFAAQHRQIGASIIFNGMNVRIAAVAEPDYHGLDLIPADIWFDSETWATVSNSEDELQDARTPRVLLWARLSEGADLSAVETQLRAAANRFASQHPEVEPDRILKATRYPDALKRRAGLAAVLFGPVAIVIMLVPSANVLGLLLIQAHARRHEMAIRTAIGASARRILRQLLTESVLLATLGVALGLIVANLAIRLIPAMLPALPIAVNFDFRIDHRTFAFSAGLAFVVVVLCGLIPTREATRNLQTAMSGVVNASIRGRWNLNHIVVVSQIAVSAVLLSVAILLTQSYSQTLKVDAGFSPAVDALILFSIPPINDSPDARRAYYLQLQNLVNGLPGVTSTALSTTVPLPMEGGGANREVWRPGGTEPNGPPATVRFNASSPPTSTFWECAFSSAVLSQQSGSRWSSTKPWHVSFGEPKVRLVR